jgi:HK97 family phage prohead protease
MTKTITRRMAAGQIQVRKSDDGKTVGITGYASVFDSVAYGEVIRSSAFNRTLAQRDNVRLLTNHEGVPLASTKSGTLRLEVDDIGLRFDADELDMANPDVQRLVSAMGRGDIDQCSFAGYFTDTVEVDGVREVREVQLVDVSVVTYPWYEETSTSLTGDRNGDLALVCLRSLAPERRDEVLALLREENTDGTNPADERVDGEADGGSEPRSEAAPQSDPDPDTEDEPRAASMSLIEARALLGLPAA